MSEDRITLFNVLYGRKLPNNILTVEFFTQKSPVVSVTPDLKDFVTAKDLDLKDRLIIYLKSCSYYYTRYLWLSKNANAKAAKVDVLTLNKHSILNLIENKAIEMFGNWIAFPIPIREEGESSQQILQSLFGWSDQDSTGALDAYVEQLLSLSTREVFAKAKFSYCNVNKIIDDIRFWD